jgi:thioredoxin 1
MSKPIPITEQSFEAEVIQSELPVLVDFWAGWCAPCKMVAPIVEEIARDYEGKLKVGKIDVDSSQAIAMKYNIHSIPTLMLFKDGKMVDSIVGAVPKSMLIPKIDKILSK